MSQARVASIWRYPVKGFGGQRLASADLRAGRGIPFDRCFAVANGVQAVGPDGAWTPCQAFVRLTRNTELPGFGLRFDEAGATASLIGPDGRVVTLGGDTGDADVVLAGWFAAGPLGPPRAVVRSRTGEAGYWDHEDAVLSLVNPATAALLDGPAGQPIDPLRFRANLLLDGLVPLAELALIGRRLRVGAALLEVLRPIDRCRATSVDPVTGDIGPNVPALLGRALGHVYCVYCGVYARVLRSGRIAPGDPVEDAGPAADAARDGARAATALPVYDWPRAAQVVERVAESTDVASFWMDDPLAPLRQPPKAGQHLRLHLVDGAGRAA